MTMEEEKTADKKGIADPVDSVKAFGKGMEPWGAPFSISRQRGLYYYVPAEHFDRLQELNELAGKDGLPELKVVGRGGMSGNRPFMLGGGLYVCVLAEHARRLQEISTTATMPYGTVETEIAPLIVEKTSIADKQPESTMTFPTAPPSLQQSPWAVSRRGAEPSGELRVTRLGLREAADAQQPETDDAVANCAPQLREAAQVPARTEITAITVQEIAPVLPAATTTPMAAVRELQQQTVLATGERERRAGEEKKKPHAEGRYVYCIINANDKNKTKSFGKIGLGSEEVYCIDYKNVSAVVSNFDGIDCGLSEENARVHNAVISRVMERHGSVLPVGFGAVFASGKILKGVLGGTYHVIKEEMKGVENKVELGLKIVANKQPGAKSPARAALAEEALESLGKIAAKTHKGKPFMERMLLNASFLVERSRMDEFTRRVEELEKKYSDAVKFQYTGPWPPYNFVSVRIGAKG